MLLFSDLVNFLVNLQQKSHGGGHTGQNGLATNSQHMSGEDKTKNKTWDIVALHVSPEMGERILISGNILIINPL